MNIIRRRLGRIGKTAWYLCGAILVLSLPTFSYLIPTAELVMGPVLGPRSPEPDSAEEVGLTGGLRAFGSLTSSHSSSFVSSPMRTDRFATPGAKQSTIAGLGMRVTPTTNPPQGPAGAVTPAPGPAPSHEGRLARLNQQLTGNNRSDAYPQDLNSFEQGYQAAMGQLFRDYGLMGYGSYGRNPFDDALPDDKDTDGDSGDNGGGDGGDGGGDTNPPPPPPPPPPPDDDVTPPVKRYSFLIAGDFQGSNSGDKVFRAARDADGFVLEGNNFKVNPVPGMVGTGTLGPLDRNQQIVWDDLDGDGRQDLVWSQLTPQGTQVELWMAGDSNVRRMRAAGFFSWLRVTSIGLLDFNKDDQLDLALLFANNPNLFIYVVEGEEFKYLKEIVLPFEPSVVVDSVFESFPRERRLYVFDGAFHRVAMLTSRNPGIFSYGLAPAVSVKSYRLDSEEDGPTETDVRVFEDSGGIALAEKRGAVWVVLGRFSITGRYPVIVFGDYLNTGARQLLCLP